MEESTYPDVGQRIQVSSNQAFAQDTSCRRLAISGQKTNTGSAVSWAKFIDVIRCRMRSSHHLEAHADLAGSSVRYAGSRIGISKFRTCSKASMANGAECIHREAALWH